MTPISLRTMLIITLSLPLALVVVAFGTVPQQIANAQLNPVQQQALDSLVTTGFTNQQNVIVGNQSFSIPYSIREGQVVAIVPAPPTMSINVMTPRNMLKPMEYLPCRYQDTYLDSKNPDGTDKAFRVNIDGHGLYWKELQNTDTYRTIGLYFGGSNGFLQVYGTQIATGNDKIKSRAFIAFFFFFFFDFNNFTVFLC